MTDGGSHARSKRETTATAVFGMLANLGTPYLSVEEINDISGSGWAGEE